MPLFLLVALLVSFGVSVIACGIALRLFPHFRSGERKEGLFRADQSVGSSGALVLPNGRRRPSSAELPLVGSRGMLPAILIGGAVTGWLMGFDMQQWVLLGILGAGLCGFWLVGFIDDWKKVHSGNGIREITKFIGVAIVAVGVALAFLHFIGSAAMAYAPYYDVPGLGTLLRHVPYAWPIFFVLLFLTVSTSSSLAADFTDGLDGLAGGVTFSAALAYAVINITEADPHHYPLTVAALALAGATLGFLPWNWPSSWKGRGGPAPRRARLIMGDSGSLALGGLLALIALADRQEISLVLVAGVFVLEGLSAVIQSRLLVKFFRRFLRVERFQASGVWFPHTEFPLPFLATPMHHHFDLVGWDRRRLVYSAWTIGALFGVLGIASALAPYTWERYLVRGMAVLIAVVLWQSGKYTRGYFVGTLPEREHRILGLFYGYPYRLFGRPLYALVDRVMVDASAITNPAEQNTLWVRMNVFDARAALGYFCYRGGFLLLAREQWERIPFRNLAVRPQIQELLAQTRQQLEGIMTVSEDDSAGTIETAMGAEPSPADSTIARRSGTTGPLTTSPTLPETSAWTMPIEPSEPAIVPSIERNIVPLPPEPVPTYEAPRYEHAIPAPGASGAKTMGMTANGGTVNRHNTVPLRPEIAPDAPLPPPEAPKEHPASVSSSGQNTKGDGDVWFRESWPEL